MNCELPRIKNLKDNKQENRHVYGERTGRSRVSFKVIKRPVPLRLWSFLLKTLSVKLSCSDYAPKNR